MRSKIKSIPTLVFILCIFTLVIVIIFIDLSVKYLPTQFASAGFIDLSMIKDFKQPIKLEGE
jgi:hypothetical protein